MTVDRLLNFTPDGK